uniref:Cytochrome c oxidase subunit 3 n=1 Tax=Dimorphostylis asiatica TaxID=2840398 RepID=A0A8F8AHB6_9CRUS|nr:cytochrome c oxidase subunit III [Dimorphostylis asiatica]
MTNFNFHSYHLVDQSPWPITSSVAAMLLTSGMVKWFNLFSMDLMVIGLISMVLSTIQWWRDVVRESAFQGLHTIKVEKGMRWGMILFIISEVLFFFSFFWAFFHSSLSPTFELGMVWPPVMISTLNPFHVPLLNTAILLTSGATVTWAHHSLMEKYHTQTVQSLILTILLGVYFTILQAYEYVEASFSVADSVYGSTFFISTGFHGLHVMVGTSLLAVMLARIMNYQMSSEHHFGFEAAAWYWHFVDVVWLFLYMSVYWWGS